MAFNANDFETEIDNIKAKIEIFHRSEEEADESFLAVGDLLVTVKNDRQLENKTFTELKKEVAKSLSGNDGVRNINKVVAVAQCDVIQRNKANLPKSWSSLYLLSRMANLQELIDSSAVTTATTRKDINTLAVKEKPLAKPRMVVELDGAITEEHINALKDALSGTSWKLVKK